MSYLYNSYLEGDISAGILEQSMGARNREGIGLSFRAVFVNLLRSPGIDSQPGLLKGFHIRAQARRTMWPDQSRFLAPIEVLKYRHSSADFHRLKICLLYTTCTAETN
jgi:hypothetical protein